MKKLTLLLEKYTEESSTGASPLSSLELINCSPIGSDTDTTVAAISTAPFDAGAVTPRHHYRHHRRDVDEDGFRFPSTGKVSCKSASAALPCTRNWSDYDELHVDKSRVRRVTQKLEAEILLHRRSLSENIIHFPLHTSPSDKARCHQMQRQRSSTHSPTPPRQLNGGSQTAVVLLPIANVVPEPPPLPPPVSAVLTLRKVGETMCLKDPQYKPSTTKDHNGVKPNPFTALAHIRGVKKILGANPKTYAAGVGDLFSSCFEMSAPFFKELVKSMATDVNDEPKSLPVSPQLTRKYSAIELKLPQRSATAATTATTAEIDDCDESEGEDLDGGGNCADAESSSDDSAVRPSTIPAARKYRANSLYTHPLFRGSSGSILKNSNSEMELKGSTSTSTLTAAPATADEDKSKELINKQLDCITPTTTTSTKSAAVTATGATSSTACSSVQSKEETSISTSFADLELNYNELKNSCELLPLKRNVNRRDSIESGFYSCFNEESDAAITNTSYNRQLCGIGSLVVGGSNSSCCYEQLKSQLMLDSTASNKIK